jgi:archaellum component FlaC
MDKLIENPKKKLKKVEKIENARRLVSMLANQLDAFAEEVDRPDNIGNPNALEDRLRRVTALVQQIEDFIRMELEPACARYQGDPEKGVKGLAKAAKKKVQDSKLLQKVSKDAKELKAGRDGFIRATQEIKAQVSELKEISEKLTRDLMKWRKFIL